jgi:hypothetical protein
LEVMVRSIECLSINFYFFTLRYDIFLYKKYNIHPQKRHTTEQEKKHPKKDIIHYHAALNACLLKRSIVTITQSNHAII